MKTSRVIFAVLLMSFTATPIHAEQGVTDTEIHIGTSGPHSGPAAPWGIVSKGTATYFKLLNERGGIYGRKVIIHDFDDGYNPAKTKAGVKRLQESIGMFCWVGIVGAETGLAVKPYLDNLKVPWVAPTDGSTPFTRPPSRYILNVYVPFIYEAAAQVRYAAQILGKKRIAILYQDAYYGRSGLDGAKGAMDKLGLAFVAQIPVPKNQENMQPAALELRKSGADAVICFLTPFQAIKLLKAGQQMQYAPQWMGPSSFSDFIYMYRLSRGLWENMIVSVFGDFNTYDEWKDCRVDYKRTTGKNDANGLFFAAGVSWAKVTEEGLRRTGRNLTRENFIKAMEGMRNFKGLMTGISYYPFNPKDPKCREGQNQVFLIKCLAKGKTQILTEQIKPDGDIIPKTEMVLAPF